MSSLIARFETEAAVRARVIQVVSAAMAVASILSAVLVSLL